MWWDRLGCEDRLNNACLAIALGVVLASGLAAAVWGIIAAVG